MKATSTIYYSPEGEAHHRSLVERVVKEGIPPEATVIFSQRNTVATIPSGGITANIKSFALPNIVNRYVYGRLRKSKARRSFANSQRLARLGFRVPPPLAFIEERTTFTFRRSYFISEHIYGLTELRSPERHDFCNDLMAALGREMARLHAAGVWMKDFSPGNVLFRRDEATGSFEFYYVDLNRINFDDRNPSHLAQMWERILFVPEQIAAATRAYAEATGRDAAEVYATAMKQWQAFTARKRKKFNKRKHQTHA